MLATESAHRTYQVERVDAFASRELFRQVARLHVDSIHSGIMEALGPNFVATVYQQLSKQPDVVTFVAIRDGEVLGFVTGSSNTADLLKKLGLRGGLRLAFAACTNAWRPRLARKGLQTLQYFFRPTSEASATETGASKPDHAHAELLAIAVAEEARDQGVGKALVRAFEDELQSHGSARDYFVTTNEEEVGSNAFYLRSGFVLLGKRPHHDLVLNVYKKELTPC